MRSDVGKEKGKKRSEWKERWRRGSGERLKEEGEQEGWSWRRRGNRRQEMRPSAVTQTGVFGTKAEQ